ncbi:hypothetical protein P7F60_12005 [Rhizobium sp. YJ-22]|uniref:hypothetical protein n=1 Tax=Rhizobium sp. YJ-22 TaxID=3037556 RepID=UPI002412359E|nr:hypothetical protein [Rhizobium sp. YJ-22]MDG3577116.1 hypothetical protein [Rhizobium sp. YJ-22]
MENKFQLVSFTVGGPSMSVCKEAMEKDAETKAVWRLLERFDDKNWLGVIIAEETAGVTAKLKDEIAVLRQHSSEDPLEITREDRKAFKAWLAS